MIKKSKFIEKNFGHTLVYFFMQNKIIQNLCIALGTIKALFPKFGPNFSQTQTDRHELIEPFHKAGVQKVMFFKICGFKKSRHAAYQCKKDHFPFSFFFLTKLELTLPLTGQPVVDQL